MKAPAIILLTLLSFTSFSQIPDYFANEPVWREKCVLHELEYCVQFTEKEIYLSGESETINGQTYHLLRKKTYIWYQDIGDPYGCGEPQYFEYDFALLRQSGDSIFQYILDEEELAYHFSFEVGDTLQGASVFEIDYEEDDVIVTAIDSVETITGPFRRFHLTSSSGNYSEYLIEGIGHANGFMVSMNTFFFSDDVCDLICYRQNGEFQFGNEAGCTVISSVDEFSEIEFNVFPNPSTDGVVEIQVDRGEMSDGLFISLSSIDGKAIVNSELMISSTDRLQLRLDDLDPGVYLLTLRSDSSIGVKRLILE